MKNLSLETYGNQSPISILGRLSIGRILFTALLLVSSLSAAEPLLEKTEVFPPGINGIARYRIPGMVVTPKGTVLAYAEARKNGSSDWGEIEIHLRRSTDGGKSWLPSQHIAHHGTRLEGNPHKAEGGDKEQTVNNPVAIVDRVTGAIEFLYCINYARCFSMRSVDDGVTWSAPVDITASFEPFRARYDWKVIATGPGHGIQTKSGRLVVPIWLAYGKAGDHKPSAAATIYSDDHGKTWMAGDLCLPNEGDLGDPNETMITELSDGRVMLVARSVSKANRKLITTSADGARDWTKPFFHEQLWEPICMASIVAHPSKPGTLIYSNPHTLGLDKDGKEIPAGRGKRENLCIKLSYDDGKTWPVNRVLDPGKAAYSDLAVLPDGTVLCLYERADSIDCARFNLEWITAPQNQSPPRPVINPINTVTGTGGLVAFWDFVKQEPDGARRFIAHVPTNTKTNYPLDAANYIKNYWGAGREATYADFPHLGRGPFGNAIRIVKETDPDFRPFLFVPRERLHNTPLDIKGAGKSVSVVVWAIRESGNHALAGIWHEGTDLKQKETSAIAKVERGQRQYALFAGLNKQGSACGHVSENGASSFLNKYALHKCNSADLSPEVPADSLAEVLDKSWQCFAMTFDQEKDELTGWLNGVSGDRWLDNPKKDNLISYAYNAYMQGHYARTPEKEAAEDAAFPKDQYYNPPEAEPLNVRVLRESADERVELREHRFTKIEVTLRGGKEVARDLVSLRLNPWWYPHDLYTPKDAQSGGPFTIGRVIHSSRSVGFTGWIGGVAVFDRALSSEEIKHLSEIRFSTRNHPNAQP